MNTFYLLVTCAWLSVPQLMSCNLSMIPFHCQWSSGYPMIIYTHPDSIDDELLTRMLSLSLSLSLSHSLSLSLTAIKFTKDNVSSDNSSHQTLLSITQDPISRGKISSPRVVAEISRGLGTTPLPDRRGE